jgi:CheY-like chemotaxis protein
LGAAFANYFWVPPFHSFGMSTLADAVGLLFFAAIGVLISALSETMHRGRRRLEGLLQSIDEGFVVFDEDWWAVLRSWKPHLLVSDIEMPGEDGYSLTRKVRELGGSDGGQIPAVALTAYGRPEDRVRSLSAGFSMHVAKPVDPVELGVIVANLAGRSASG